MHSLRKKKRRLRRTEGDDEDGNFTRLSDDLLLKIFTHIGDTRSLTRCLSVSTLFRRLVPFTPSVSLTVPVDSKMSTQTSPTMLMRGMAVSVSLSDTTGAMNMVLISRKASDVAFPYEFSHWPRSYPTVSPRWVRERLSCFRNIKTLNIDLMADLSTAGWIRPAFRISDSFYIPSDMMVPELDGILKWKASFGGAGFESCYILGASCLRKTTDYRQISDWPSSGLIGDKGEQFTRALWIKYCLMAASITNHYAVKTVESSPPVREVVSRDPSRNASVHFSEEWTAAEVGNSCSSSSRWRTRRKKRKLGMKMWYCLDLELPESGHLMEGATFIAIRPDFLDDCGGHVDLLESAFDDDGGKPEVWFGEFVREMGQKMESPFIRMQNDFNLEPFFD